MCKTVQYPTPPYLSFHIKDMYRVDCVLNRFMLSSLLCFPVFCLLVSLHLVTLSILYYIHARLHSESTLHLCHTEIVHSQYRAVAMRFEVVWLQQGVTLLKAVAQRHVVLIIPHEAWEKFTFIFELSGWALVTPSCFEDQEESLSNYLKPSTSSSVNCGHMAANRSAGHTAEFMNIGRNVVVASKSGRVETRPTRPVTMAL